MKIMLQEMKKIFRPIPLVILVLFTCFSFYVFIFGANGIFTSLTTMHVSSDWIKACKDIIEIAGPTVEDGEIAPVYNTLKERYTKEINEYISNNDKFAAAGVYNYEDYVKLNEKIEYSIMPPDFVVDVYESEDEDSDEIEKNSEDEFFPENELSRFSVNGDSDYDINADYTLSPEEQIIADENFFGSMVGSVDQKLDFLNGKHDDVVNNNLLESKAKSYLSEMEYFLQNYDFTDYEIKKINEVMESESWRSIISEMLISTADDAVKILMLIMIITFCFLFGAIIMRDQMTGTTYLQYSSRKGKKILSYQFLAIIVSTFIIVTLEVAVVAVLFIPNGWNTFLDIKMNSMIDTFSFYHFSGTFGEYLLILCAMIYLLAFGCAFIVFVFSKITHNYISMLLMVVPWAAFSYFITISVSSQPFNILPTNSFSWLYSITKISYIEVYVCILFFIVTLAISLVVLQRHKKTDVV